MEWVWGSRRQLASSSSAHQHQSMVAGTGASFTVSQEAPERKLFTNKIKVVENKLRAHNPRAILEQQLIESRHKQAPFLESLRRAAWSNPRCKKDILSSEELVDELIALASDKNITGRSYIGLNLFV
jgi:hypothetical protein